MPRKSRLPSRPDRLRRARRPTRAGRATRGIAVQFVVNYEEGGERSILHGDRHPRPTCTRSSALTPRKGERDENVEFVYEYGSRAGFWRIMRLFERARAAASPATRSAWRSSAIPMRARAMIDAPATRSPATAGAGSTTRPSAIAEEREHMRWRSRRSSRPAARVRSAGTPAGCSANTRNLVVEEGGFLYDSDAYNDDLPYWVTVDGKRPSGHPLHARQQRHEVRHAPRASTPAQDFFTYLRDAFDMLYERASRRAEDDVGRPALPPDRPARARRRARALPRPRPAPRQGLDLPARRHRPALAHDASLRRRRRKGT